MDIWVTRNVAGMRSGWWLELAGIVVIGLSLWLLRPAKGIMLGLQFKHRPDNG